MLWKSTFRVLRRQAPLLAMLPWLASSCIGVIRPSRDFAAYAPAAPPDYAQPANWAALPTRRDSADAVLPGARPDQQRTASADVFFLHPTTSWNRHYWNANVANAQLNQFTDRTAIRKQAGAFNAAGRVYAPRYRQATLYSFFEKNKVNSPRALEVAYADVQTAFRYYLAHYNQGRPIILAGHSQGTVHAKRLLHDFFEQDPQLRKQLVAAYLVGYDVRETEFQTLRPCEDSTQTGCYVSWNTTVWGADHVPFHGAVVTNPLTWTRDTAAAPRVLNRGGSGNWPRLDAQVVDAKAANGLLWVHPPAVHGYRRFWLPGHPELWQSYHIVDYALFYSNIRQNAVARVRAWQQGNAARPSLPSTGQTSSLNEQ